jgi:hypothetical protein
MIKIKVLAAFCLLGSLLSAKEFSRYPDEEKGWFGGEYVYWWMRNSPAPEPLVVSGPNVAEFAPVLDEPGTKVVLGNKSINNGGRSGGRFFGNVWIDPSKVFGLGASYLFLGKNTYKKSVSANGLAGSQCLTFPFFNPVTGSESSAILAQEDLYSAKAVLKVKNSMQYADGNLFFQVLRNQKGSNFMVLAGFLWWNLKENLIFTVNSPTVTPPIDIFMTTDQFSVSNNFYGGQVGVDGNYLWDRFFIQGNAKIALGQMNGNLSIKGNLSTNNFDGYGAPQDFAAGYTAMSTNSGRSSKNKFSIVPQASFDLGYSVVDNVDLSIGYTFLYVTEVLFATSQIDHTINPSQAPAISNTSSLTVTGEASPERLFKTSQFWAQGINARMTIRF